MSGYTWANLKIEFDNSSGVAQDISQYVTTFAGLKPNAATVDVTPAGVSYTKMLWDGLITGDAPTIEVVYDDTTLDALLNDLGCQNTAAGTRTLKVTWGGTKTTSVETIITGYDRVAVKGQPTMATLTLQCTGALTEV